MKSLRLLRFCLLANLILLLNFSVFAQTRKFKDPLHKPDVWQKIEASPQDEALWAEYLGKLPQKLSVYDKKKISIWKKNLEELQNKPNQESTLANVVNQRSKPNNNNTLNQDNSRFKSSTNIVETEETVIAPKMSLASLKTRTNLPELQQKNLDDIAGLMLAENPEVRELKRNIYANFVILEDAYQELFKDHGLKYKTYDQVHPEGEYSQLKWIEEQDQKIQAVKEKRVKALYKRYTASASSNNK
ncbi:MAG: hypothetical protein EAZ97_10495 [Bacteroidetes bacterium]|nr:MAG: hypothetical protein EAZ97_10495 [Bacteroidota bacterium]